MISARKVGQTGKGPRLVIAKFKDAHDKFELFKYQTKLRENAIRISNDLSFFQCKELKELNSRGLQGYFKNGKLVLLKIVTLSPN